MSTIVALERVKKQLIVEWHGHHRRKNRVKEQKLRQNKLCVADDSLPVHTSKICSGFTPGARIEGVAEVLPDGCKEFAEQSDQLLHLVPCP